MLTKIYYHDGVSYTIRLIKSVMSFTDNGQRPVNMQAIEYWRQGLNCDAVLNVNGDTLLFLNKIEDAEIINDGE